MGNILYKIIGGLFEDKKPKTTEDLYLEYWKNKQKRENRRNDLILLFLIILTSITVVGFINLLIHK